MPPEDMTVYYKTVVRPVLEYACQVLHPGITTYQSETLENIQKRAFKTSFPDLPYKSALTVSAITALKDRRIEQCRRFYHQVRHKDSILSKHSVKRPTPDYLIRRRHDYEIPIPRN